LKYPFVSEHVNEKDVVTLTKELVKIPSTSGEEADFAEYLSEKMKSLGFEVSQYEAEKNRPNVVGVLESGLDGPTLMLNGHIDTVPPGDLEKWSHEPYAGEIEERRLYGRGSCDMKGGIAAMLSAAEATIRSGVELKGDILLLFAVDEERGGYKGTGHVLDQGVRGDYALIAEPSKMNILIANKGDLGMNLKVYGKTAHAANPHMGVNAIHKMVYLVDRILEIPEEMRWNAKTHRLVGPPTIGISVIKGGIQRNMVPDYCEAVVDRRIVPGLEDIEEARVEIETQVTRAMEEDPQIKAELETFLEVEACEISEDEEIVRTLSKCYETLMGAQPTISGVSYFTDAHFMVNNHGIPTAIFGPGSIDQAHAVDEYVEIDQLVNVSKIYALTISDILG
jgi:succinyl-diaminopimelate desuccinylase